MMDVEAISKGHFKTIQRNSNEFDHLYRRSRGRGTCRLGIFWPSIVPGATKLSQQHGCGSVPDLTGRCTNDDRGLGWAPRVSEGEQVELEGEVNGAPNAWRGSGDSSGLEGSG